MTATHAAKMTAYDALHAALVAAQQERPQRDDWVPTATGQELGWVLHERDVMLAETNRWRIANGLPEIGLGLILRAENHASGHVDYTHKFALYCAEIAVGDEHWAEVSR